MRAQRPQAYFRVPRALNDAARAPIMHDGAMFRPADGPSSDCPKLGAQAWGSVIGRLELYSDRITRCDPA